MQGLSWYEFTGGRGDEGSDVNINDGPDAGPVMLVANTGLCTWWVPPSLEHGMCGSMNCLTEDVFLERYVHIL